MKLLQNSKFTGPALLLLLALNTTLLVLLLINKPDSMQHGPIPPIPSPGPKDFLVEELKMDEPQQKKFDALIKDHRSSVEKIQQNIRIHRDSLIEELKVPVIDSSKINSMAAHIGNGQMQMEQINFYHFRHVREICTPEQKNKFDTIIRGALRMMGPPQGPPGPPRNGPPPPHRNGPPPHGPAPPHGSGSSPNL